MSAYQPPVAWVDGRLVAFENATVSIEDRGLQFGESVYEVVPLTRGRARLLAEHAARMRAGAAQIGLAHGVPDDELWQRLSTELAAEQKLEEGLLIAYLTGGRAARSHLASSPPKPTFFAYLRAHRFPRAAECERGIAAITHPELRWSRCDLKTAMLLPSVIAKRAAAERGASEAILFGSDGVVHEGASSNVFVVEGGRIRTPRQNERLLAGITRQVVAALATRAGYALEPDELSLERLRAADELFVTSTSQTLMPVLSLDAAPIGNGRAGDVALELGRQLRRELELGD